MIAVTLCTLIFPTTLIFFGLTKFAIYAIVELYEFIILFSLFRMFKEEESKTTTGTTNLTETADLPLSNPAVVSFHPESYDFYKQPTPLAPPRYV